MDWLKNIKLHSDRIDWTNPAHTALSLTRQLMGPCGYLKGLTQQQSAQKEIGILRKAGYSRWGGESEYKPFYQHFLTLIKLLLPKKDITPNLADAVQFFCCALAKHRKALNLIGSQNSSKSTSLSIIPMICLAISPKNTASFIATPHDKASDSTLWGDTLSVYYEIEDSSPWLWPNASVKADRRILVDVQTPKAGLIEYRGIKEVGKYKGMKTVKTEAGEPLLLVSIDEFNEVKTSTQAFLQALSNLVSQQGFMALTSQNFTTEDNMGGILCQPKALFPGNPDSYAALDKDLDFFWYSHLSGITLRYDGLRSPNVLANRVIYPYLFKPSDLKFQEEHYGVDSPEYYSQVRSFPRTGLGELTVLSSSCVNTSRHTDTEWTPDREDGRAAHLDPAFGGRDKPVWGFAHFGLATSVSGDGKQREHHPLLWFSHPMVTLTLNLDMLVDDGLLRRIRAIGADWTQFVRGSEFSVFHQLALQHMELCLRFAVPPENSSYDFSMCHEIVNAMRDLAPKEVEAISYDKEPTGYYLERFKMTADEQVHDINSELAFLVADLFSQRQIRGGQFISEAITQMCRTRYELKGKKYQAEKKKVYKARYQNQSPDERDVLMGIVGKAHKRGFRPTPMGKANTGVGGKIIPLRNPFLRSRQLKRISI